MAKTTKPETPQAMAVPLTSLQPADWNPRSISDERFQNLCHSIETDRDFLWLRPILATKDGTIFAGNTAEHLGWTEPPPSRSTSPSGSPEYGAQR